jgi:hypothetical protein
MNHSIGLDGPDHLARWSAVEASFRQLGLEPLADFAALTHHAYRDEDPSAPAWASTTCELLERLLAAYGKPQAPRPSPRSVRVAAIERVTGEPFHAGVATRALLARLRVRARRAPRRLRGHRHVRGRVTRRPVGQRNQTPARGGDDPPGEEHEVPVGRGSRP